MHKKAALYFKIGKIFSVGYFDMYKLNAYSKHLIFFTNDAIGLMHLAFFLGESPYYSPSLFLVSYLKVEVYPLKINIFQRFKYS